MGGEKLCATEQRRDARPYGGEVGGFHDIARFDPVDPRESEATSRGPQQRRVADDDLTPGHHDNAESDG